MSATASDLFPRTSLAVMLVAVACVSPMTSSAATTTLYQISSAAEWAAGRGQCSGPTGIYERSLSPDVLLRLFPYPGPARPLPGTALGISFVIGDGHRVRLLNQDVLVSIDDGSPTTIRISSFRSIKEEFSSDQDLIGTGRFARDPTIEPKPAGDVFGVRIAIAESHVGRFKIVFPNIEIDGKAVKVDDVSFRQEDVGFLPCVQ